LFLQKRIKNLRAPIGTIFTDSIYTPIKNVKYAIENFRVEQKTDYEKLIFDIETDGSISPKDALTEAAKDIDSSLSCYFLMSVSLLKQMKLLKLKLMMRNHLHMRQLLKTRLIDMDLSVRALNCLKSSRG
jgi:DNA-directed RNA polymerase subunit alpha